MTRARNQSWIWLETAVMLAVHEEQLAEHGGGAGIRDEGLMHSAMARPRQLANYGNPDLFDLAAAYGYGLARNHPFVDGNKRTAFVATELFLLLNGQALQASDTDCVITTLALAAGELTEADFAAWLRHHSAFA